MQEKIIQQDKSIIPSLDVQHIDILRDIVAKTHAIDAVGGYKIGFELVITHAMQKVVQTIREFTDKPIIYDHQKAGTDIPAMGERFMRACTGVDAVILFPQSGPVTLKEWIKAAQKERVRVIIGGEMTHPGYLESDDGFIKDDGPKRIYELAAELGVQNFVVPGNKPEKIAEYKQLLEAKGITPIFFSPGLIAQNGDITQSAQAAGEHWHAIIGRGIYEADDPEESTKTYASQLTNP